MGVIQSPSRKIDRRALSFAMMGTGGGSFVSAVVAAVNENPDIVTAVDLNAPTATDVMDLASGQDDNLYVRLMNNNTNLRCQIHATSANRPLSLINLQYTILPFDITDFNGGGMEIRKINQYEWKATSNKCGVYRISVGLHFITNGGVQITNPALALFKNKLSGTNQNYGCVLWRSFGNLNEFWANGCDLMDLECGESVDLRIYHDGGVPINLASYDYDAWIAINYTGNQY